MFRESARARERGERVKRGERESERKTVFWKFNIWEDFIMPKTTLSYTLGERERERERERVLYCVLEIA